MVIALSQLNRELERDKDKRPSLADLRESGQLEQDADVVLLLHRPEYYFGPRMKVGKGRDAATVDVEGLGVIYVAKLKEGEAGSVPVRWYGEFTRYDDWTGAPPDWRAI